MITAVDTNVLLDVYLDDPDFADWSIAQLKSSYEQGALVICEVVYAELAVACPSKDKLESILRVHGIHLINSHPEVLWEAARMWKAALQNKTLVGGRILPDFLVGAHALINADRLLTRDRGFYKKYFRELSCVTPTA